MPRRSKFDLELDIRFCLAQFFKEESKLLKTILNYGGRHTTIDKDEWQYVNRVMRVA